MNIHVIDLQNSLWMSVLQTLRHDVYHLPEYLAIEANRTESTPEAFIAIDGEKVFFVPYLLRECDSSSTQKSALQKSFDVVSPYGYPGILLSEAAASSPRFADSAINALKQTLQSNGVCSAFFRLHPILNHSVGEVFDSDIFTLNGETVSIDLTLSEAQLWAHTRKGHQSTINKCKRFGFKARMVPFEQFLDPFIEIYEETMSRVGAKPLYFFSRDYFTGLLNLGEKIHLCIVELEDQIVCASLFFECCGIVQAHLGGTRTRFLQESPFNLLLDYVRYWSKQRGNEFLHLGGGIGAAKDHLYTFKSGFSRQRHTFLTLRLITNETTYLHLVNLRAESLSIPVEELLKSEFFPAYRSA